MTKVELAYFAGIIDGEASVGKWRAGKNRIWQARIVMTHTYRPLGNRLVHAFGGHIHEAGVGPLGRKQRYQWMMSKQPEVRKALRLLIPFLDEKRTRAKQTLKFLDYLQAHPRPIGRFR